MRRIACVVVVATIASFPVGAGVSARDADPSPLDGRWTTTWTALALRHAGLKPYDVRTEAGPVRSMIADGRYEARFASGRVASGRITVDGDVARIVPEKRDPHDQPGRAVFMRFSVFRDRLTWSKIPGRYGWDALLISQWTRVS